MTRTSLILSGVWHFWRTHLGVLLGTALATMVLAGSLFVGDSVKATLEAQARMRFGQASTALFFGERHVRADVLPAGAGAAALLLEGTVSQPGGEARGRLPRVQVLGVDTAFWRMSPTPWTPGPEASGEDAAWLNSRAAEALMLKPGDPVLVRVLKPGQVSRDALFSGDENDIVTLRMRYAGAVDDAAFGRFSLAANQVPPSTVFVPHAALAKALDMQGRANLLLLRDAASLKEIETKKALTDLSLTVAEVPGGLEVRSPRVFLDAPVVTAVPEGLKALTYLVNGLKAGDKATPYSMVTAVDSRAAFLPKDLKPKEIVISQWLADDLGIGVGAAMDVAYYVMGERRQLDEKTTTFTVRAIMPMDDPAMNPSWMPDFPGLKDAKNCRDWKPGFSIDNTRFRPKDEEYWQTRKGTPKAFISLEAGQALWSNRWGNLTAVRVDISVPRAALEERLLGSRQIADLAVRTDRTQALEASRGMPVDFGGLFAGFSFFPIAAAAGLTAMLFVFSVEQRRSQIGLLQAVGFSPKTAGRMLLAEGAIIATIGAVLGVIAAFGFTALVLEALGSIWKGAVGSVRFTFAAQWPSAIGGVFGSIIMAVIAMAFTARSRFKESPASALAGADSELARGSQKRAGWRLAIGLIAAALVLAAVSGGNPGAFFGAGALLLTGGLLLIRARLRQIATRQSDATPTPSGLGATNATRRPGRSMATAGVLASGVFLVVAVDAFRLAPETEWQRPRGGTGGFALIGESAIPFHGDLNTPEGRQAAALPDAELEGVRIVQARVRDGDEASCLNLNRALQPRILGVRPADLKGRFTFAGALESFGKVEEEWTLLDKDASALGAIPVIADAATLQWALQKPMGEPILIRTDSGAEIRVAVVATVSGSLLQGNLVMGEKAFVRAFPDVSGYRFYLVDVPAARVEAVRTTVMDALQDRGLELVSAPRRLADYQNVENTYLSIFQVLGALGLILGTAGVGVVISRNILERRAEFAVMEAVGFSPGQVRTVAVAEFRWLVVAGLILGTVSALLAVAPSIVQRGADFPWLAIAGLVVALGIGGIFWSWLATRLSLRGSQLGALRSE